MKVSELTKLWESAESGELADTYYNIQLPVEDVAKLAALLEIYPNRTHEQLLRDLISAALHDLEKSLPYIKGNKIIAEDELGDPIYEDAGLTPRFLSLSKKHLISLKKQEKSE